MTPVMTAGWAALCLALALAACGLKGDPERPPPPEPLVDDRGAG